MRTARAELGRRLGTLIVGFSTSACAEDVIDHGNSGITGYPTTSPARVCGSAALQGGPASVPPGAVSVAAGDNSGVDFGKADTTYWFAPGVHTLGPDQIGPADNSTFIGAPGAILDGQNVKPAAFSQHAVNVRIAYLEIRNFASPNDEGVVNHDGGTGWIIENNYLHQNTGAAVFVSSYSTLRDNCVSDNGQYGLQGIGPGGGGSGVDLVIDHNEIAHNGEAATDHLGGGAKVWNIDGASVTHNWIHDNLGIGLSVDANSRDFAIEGNLFADNYGEAIYYGISYNAQIRGNSLQRNALGKGADFAARGDDFPVAAVYVSESGGDRRVSGTPTLEISRNHFENNWGGVVLWESADRFCGSPTAARSGYCTIVSADATPTTCAQPDIATAPLYDDCRWKTQKVIVQSNEFHVAPANIGCTNELCARQAILSNAGSTPPYVGTAVEDAITFTQDNHFSQNRYFGPWRFTAHDTSVVMNFAAWQAPPYAQDQGSTLE